MNSPLLYSTLILINRPILYKPYYRFIRSRVSIDISGGETTTVVVKRELYPDNLTIIRARREEDVAAGATFAEEENIEIEDDSEVVKVFLEAEWYTGTGPVSYKVAVKEPGANVELAELDGTFRDVAAAYQWREADFPSDARWHILRGDKVTVVFEGSNGGSDTAKIIQEVFIYLKTKRR